jgi:hypothetical protein
MKIRLRNFQAIGDAKIETAGFCAITGRTNLGKSALLRGLSAIMFGLPGEHFIRHGEEWTGGSLKLEDDQGPLDLRWRKVATKSRKPNLQPALEINGKTHTKTGKDHKALTAPHGILEIEATTRRLRPQTAAQHDPIFLVADNETTAAEVLNLLGRADVVTEAQRNAKRDLNQAEEKRKIRTSDREKAATRLAETDHVPGLRQELEEKRARTQAREEQRAKHQTLTDHLTTLETLSPKDPPPAPPGAKPPESLKRLTKLRELTDLTPRDVPAAPPTPKAPPTATLERLTTLLTLEQERKRTIQEREATEDDLVHLEKERETLEATLKTCPTCGRAFDGH